MTSRDAATSAEHRSRIVVGVSATSSSPSALRWAVAEAAAHNAEVVAVRAWRAPSPSTSVAGRPPLVDNPTEPLFEQEKERLAADVAAVLGERHEVRTVLVRGGRRRVLIAASAEADLLVIDAPRRTAPSDSPILAHRLIYNAHCPVVVMPTPIIDQPDSAVVAAGKAIGRGLLRAAGTSGRPGVRAPILNPTDDTD